MASNFRLVAFDMDGTLVEDRSSWLLIHHHLGTASIAEVAYQEYVEGLIDYEEFMRRDIGAWPKPLRRSQLEGILAKVEVRREAEGVIRSIREGGVETALISAGLDLLAERVGEELKIDHVVANRLCIDEEGFLTGEGIVEVELSRKDRALKRLAEDLGISLRECVAVGDSLHDASFLKAAGLGLLLGDRELAERIGVRAISSLEEVLSFL